MRSRYVKLAIFVVALSTLTTAFPQVTTTERSSCVASNDHLYKPGVDGVKPPELQKDEDWKNTPGTGGPFEVEVVLNAAARVCEVNVLSAKNRAAAESVAKYLAEHWHFKPATRHGKPVPVMFRINFSSEKR